MGWQCFERFKIFAATAGKKKPQETSFDKHWHPEQSRIVHEAKQIDGDLGDQEYDPEEDEGSRVQRESLSHAFPVPVVVGQYG